jgi:hypothetical protein
MEAETFLLDIDACIFARRHEPEWVMMRLMECGFDRVCISEGGELVTSAGLE